MKCKVITAPFYCLHLQRVFQTNEVVEIKDTKRAREIIDAGMLKEIKSTKRKVKVDKDA